MVKVITYGTYDLLHYGHINLLKRAKELGDYLIVGVTAEGFDRERGKINVHQSLMERIEGVRSAGIADEIIVEEYEGQKIDDIRRLGVDVFTVGSDWKGKFDYLEKYCKVVYLDRTEGISSTEIRAGSSVKIGFVGNEAFIVKFAEGSESVNGLKSAGIYTDRADIFPESLQTSVFKGSYGEFLDGTDCVYFATPADRHEKQIEEALLAGKHVLCESPVADSEKGCEKLFSLAEKRGLVLMDGIKTAYSLAYRRLLLLAQTGKIGRVVSVESTCTSLLPEARLSDLDGEMKGIYDWGPTALLPVFQLLGTEYVSKDIIVGYFDEEKKFDAFTEIRFLYPDAVANVKIGKGVKSEGELIVSGTKGYLYVPAPWWKSEYFEIRYENANENKRFFFQSENEGICYELLSFCRNAESGGGFSHIAREVSQAISKTVEEFEKGTNVKKIKFKR